MDIYNIIFMSGAHGYGWGRLDVCGSAVVRPLWRLGGFGTVVFGNIADHAWSSRVPMRIFFMMKFTS